MSLDNRNLNPNDTFGIYRAEWLNDDLYKTFARPNYYPELETHRPCVIVGGRGTGKTTVLRCLSYKGHYTLWGNKSNFLENLRYVGLYHRINTNRVNAFRGPQLPNEIWERVFGHYINLLLCEKIVEFLKWAEKIDIVGHVLSKDDCNAISASLSAEKADDFRQLYDVIALSKHKLEIFLNGFLDLKHIPPLSIPGVPVDTLCSRLSDKYILKGKKIFFILDEFENLLSYQQQIINGLIKHCGEHYTFKIGVKELGWRDKSVNSHGEFLKSPADYELLDIGYILSGGTFYSFARSVCNIRGRLEGNDECFDITKQLGSFTDDDKAIYLGVNSLYFEARNAVKRVSIQDDIIDSYSAVELLCLYMESQVDGTNIFNKISYTSRHRNEIKPIVRIYSPSVLSHIGMKSSYREKLYCGWDTFLKLSHGNIRYLLELVYNARVLHQRQNGDPNSPIDMIIQTKATRWVAEKNLGELEGVSTYGAPLRKLILGLGAIFSEVLNHPLTYGAAINRFHFKVSPENESVLNIFNHGIMYLALIREPRYHIMAIEVADYFYSVHPIFYPYLGISVDPIRSLSLSEHDILQIADRPLEAAREILQTLSQREILLVQTP